MRRMADLHRSSTRQKLVRTAQTAAIETSQKLGSRIAMEIWQAEGVGCDVPPGPEPEEIRQWSIGVSRFGCQHTVDRGVSVVDGCCVLRGELGQVVLQLD